MRLDMFLKKSRIIKQRSKAKEAGDVGAVTINGNKAKPSKEIKVGDVVEINFTNRYLKFRVEEIPQGNIRKNDAKDLVSIIEDKSKDMFE